MEISLEPSILNENKTHLNNKDYAVTLPGDLIQTNNDYLCGHGTFNENNQVYSSLYGVITRINKLLSVKSAKCRYKGEVGDVVIGRISLLDNKRWKVDINSNQDAVLHLSSIILPGGEQRRRTQTDELQMRKFFIENDLICAEVQTINRDGTILLHTRNTKYGKLENGICITVNSSLISHLSSHFVTLDCGVDLVLGKNGNIWITEVIDYGYNKNDTELQRPLVTVMEENKLKHAQKNIDYDTRIKISRVVNSIRVLNELSQPINPQTIMLLYKDNINNGLPVSSMCNPSLFPKYNELLYKH